MDSVLITGSSKGLGKELALVFAKNNYDVLLHGRDKTNLNFLKKEIVGMGVYSDYIVGDLKLEKTISNITKVAKEKDISVLVNNAGVFCPGLPFENLPEEIMNDLIMTNLYAPIKLSRAIYPIFAKKNSGAIININSIIGLENKKFRSVACACKYGLRGFTDSLRMEAYDKNISILGVYPTRIKTSPGMEDAMDPVDVAQKIYDAYTNNLQELILDGRPRK